ncbi:uncharacterized protein LOC133317119 [Gastrolobium bilobum]|uniref:uncharacterized protein LOC133317119 n=1 Tax=Gastrolobium bilobum TaxID=150636 RepID=UPI002AB05FD7|nr:uncharacterized protein LOC133317119 [Gastrolobium bilobum]
MGDPRFAVPYNDPYDAPMSPSFFNFSNPTLADLTFNDGASAALPPQQSDFHHGVQQGNDGATALPQQQSFYPGGQQGNTALTHQSYHGVQQGNNDLTYSEFDPMIQDNLVYNNFPYGGAENFEAGSSQMHVNMDQSQQTNENLGSQNPNQVMALAAYWPQTQAPFFCSCCHVLREIVYTNGINFEKLEIHGRLGIVTHAIHYKNITNGGPSSSNHQYEMIDFCSRSINEVKHFLVEYCQGKTKTGYTILQEHLSVYYEALCVGLDWTDDLNDDFTDLNPSGGAQADDMEQEAPRLCLAAQFLTSYPIVFGRIAQRERAGRMTLSDFSNYFHLPIDEAAKQVNLCPTVMKKICRKAGLVRWPFRKVKSLSKQISILRKTSLESADAATKATTEAEINRLKEEMIQHCGGIAPTALNFENANLL